jgi:dTDP-4-dehydrorhamnose 3,5-epimerase
MRFSETAISGVTVVDIEPIRDDRGYFARTWCSSEFAAAGLEIPWVQSNIGVSDRSLTLRGMHYQNAPYEEYKLVRCTRGRVYDVAIDLRRGSPTYREAVAYELAEDDQRSLLIPPGCAHGYLTLEDNTHLEYLTSVAYVRDAVRGVRHDDAAFDVSWPAQPTVISDQDLNWPVWLDEFASDTSA